MSIADRQTYFNKPQYVIDPNHPDFDKPISEVEVFVYELLNEVVCLK